MKEKSNKINCHSRVFLSGISTLYPSPVAEEVCGGLYPSPLAEEVRGGLYPSPVAEEVCGGLYPSPLAGEGRVRGFTLLEILVAVLIIGILVAVAVPQYQKAVLKSRFSSLMPLGKALRDGNESYYLEHGSYTNDPTKLDVRANNSNAQITLGNEDQHKYVLLTRDDINNNLRIYQQRSPNFPGETHCEALIDNAQANWLCRDALHGTLVGNKYGYTVYSLNPETVGTLARIYYDNSVNISNGDIAINSGTSRFNNATCVASYGWFPCSHGTYVNGSVCVGNPKVGAGNCGGTFDNSVCVGGSNELPSCAGTFKNNSICYCVPSRNTTCGCNWESTTYDGSSCCAGAECTRDKCADKPGVTREIPDMSTYIDPVRQYLY